MKKVQNNLITLNYDKKIISATYSFIVGANSMICNLHHLSTTLFISFLQDIDL